MKRKWIGTAAVALLLAVCIAAPASAATIGGATVTGNEVRLRSEASTASDANIITEMSAGTFLLVEERLDGWYKVVWNGTEGYVSASFASFSESAEGTYDFSTATGGTDVNLRAGASTATAVVKNLKDAGSALTVTGVSGQWLRVTDAAGASGYVRSDLARYKSSQTATRATAAAAPAASSAAAAAPAAVTAYSGVGENMAQTAQLYVGYAYRWGGMSPSTGFDCSGFVNYICNQYGISLHRVAQDIYTYDGVFVSEGDLRPGDILCFGYGPYSITHVGMYVGNEQMVHASTSTTGVIYSPVDSNYYTRMLVGAKRVT